MEPASKSSLCPTHPPRPVALPCPRRKTWRTMTQRRSERLSSRRSTPANTDAPHYLPPPRTHDYPLTINESKSLTNIAGPNTRVCFDIQTPMSIDFASQKKNRKSSEHSFARVPHLPTKRKPCQGPFFGRCSMANQERRKRRSYRVVIPRPERMRRFVSTGFGWVDARLLKDGWLMHSVFCWTCKVV